MKSKHQKLLSWRKAKGCTLNVKIDLDRLFETAKERERFEAKWKDFIASDTDIETSPAIPNGQVWQIQRIIFADNAINDGLSGGFQETDFEHRCSYVTFLFLPDNRLL